MLKTLVALAALAFPLVATQPAFAAFKLEVSEVWPGNFAAPDVTPDWFEVTNRGTTTYVAATDGNLFFDDDSVDPTASVLLQGITSIAPGQAVIFVDGGSAGVTTFLNFWGGLLPSGLQVGFYTNNNSGLSSGGDTVALWVSANQPVAGMQPSVLVTFPGDSGHPGSSYDERLQAFSSIGNAAGAVEKDAPVPANLDPTIASPGSVQTSSSGVAGVDLHITEIWPGNTISPDSTNDWFEITNEGNTAWLPAVNGNLYYDDNSATASLSVQLTGITTILPHESVIFVETTGNSGVADFKNFWESRVGHSLKVGTYQGGGLSLSETNGDQVNIWMTPVPPTASDPILLSASFGTGLNGASFDVQLNATSVAGNAAHAIQVNRSGLPPEPTTASPGRLPPIPAPAVPLAGIWLVAPALAGLGTWRLRRRRSA